MPILPKATKAPWITPNKGGHHGRIRTADDKFYHTTTWRKCRAKYIGMHPLCEECQRHNRITRGHMVDHITPIKQGGARLNFNNLQTMCNKCHASKSGKEARG